jgi:CBS domain-containing protein
MEHNTDITATNDLAADQPERPSSATRVADIMSRKLVALSAHHTFGQAVQLMTDSPFRHFLVIHADGRPKHLFRWRLQKCCRAVSTAFPLLEGTERCVAS